MRVILNDSKYWLGYHEKSEKSKDFEDTFGDAVEKWNSEAEDAKNEIKGSEIKTVKKIADKFFKDNKWISSDIVMAMIMQN